MKIRSLLKVFCLEMVVAATGLLTGYAFGITVIGPKDSLTFNQRLLLNDESNSLINQQLDQLVANTPNVARVRLGLLIGPARITDRNWPLFRYDVINLRAPAGGSPGPAVSDESLSDWPEAYIKSLLLNRCSRFTFHETGRVFQRRMTGLHVNSNIVCPINNRKGELVASMNVVWDDPSVAPALAAIAPTFRKTAQKIFEALEIRLDPRDRR
jgi:hypothetical protein